ncbi:VC0807 family protein [Caulobacter sp. S45]|uniref:VC0807 family protein n=1 Tax=Caulobacter sp. S45 TaxID=1641861 RepID=UPI002738BDCE|nr:VC0807 family protein [Caulobacter sp. S45]
MTEAGAVSRIDQAATYLRGHGLRLAGEALVNFVLPVVIFDWAKPTYGEVGGLLASSAPPLLWSLVEFVRRRRVDALSMLVLAGIMLSLLAFLGGGGVRFLQLREKLVTALIGLVFLGSVAIGRPLIYQLARAGLARKSAAELAEFEALRGGRFFERTMTLMTLVWGFGLLGEAAIAAILVFVLPIRTYLMVGPVLGYAAMGGLSLWNVWFGKRQRRIGASRRARNLD